MRWRHSVLLALLALIVIVALVWWPVVRHYRVNPPAIGADALGTLRGSPPNAVLMRIAEQSLLSDNPIRGAPSVPLAERVLEGSLEYPLMDAIPISPQFAPADLLRGNGTLQNLIASLVVPDWLLRAYEITGRAAFFDAARDYLASFIEYERSLSIPRGFIWSGHALAARASILTRFWRHYRGRDDYDPALAAKILLHASRIAEMLAKPEHFAAHSNHGLMHNLGLLQIATAFPALPRANDYRRIALARTNEQLGFYFSPEGVVLEHSAGYHFTGILLTGFLRELAQQAPEGVAPALDAGVTAALGFYDVLRRPDGTLPMVGNTLSMQWTLPEALDRPAPGARRPAFERAPVTALHPISGYAVWWDPVQLRADASAHTVQTTIPWSNFPGHAHKLADEMSMILWAGGATWLTNAGYWPGAAPHREQANGWSGSSAPHLVGEPASSKRETTLRAHLDAPELRMLDLERTIAGGPVLRRQIIQLHARRWIVLDTHLGGSSPSAAPMRTMWTVYPGTEVARADGGTTLRLTRKDAPVQVTLNALTGDPGSVELLAGSVSPFGGWAVVDRRPVATHTLRITNARPGGWILTVIELDDPAHGLQRSVRSATVQTPEAWRIELERGEHTTTVSRSGRSIAISPLGSAASASFALETAPDVVAHRAAIHESFAAIRAKYPRYRDLVDYRWRVSAVALGGWIGLLGVLALPIARRRRAVALALNGLFAAGGLWLAFGYLA